MWKKKKKKKLVYSLRRCLFFKYREIRIIKIKLCYLGGKTNSDNSTAKLWRVELQSYRVCCFDSILALNSAILLEL
jgi:hypothetical protein